MISLSKISRISLCTLALLGLSAAFASAATHRTATVPSADTCSITSEVGPSAVNLLVTDQIGALIGRAEIELRCGVTVVTGITREDNTITFHARSGSYTLISRVPGFAEKAQQSSSPPPHRSPYK